MATIIRNNILIFYTALLFSFCSFTVFAQKDSTQKTSKWSLGIVASPNVGYGYAISLTGQANDWTKEYARMGYTAGLNMNYRLNKIFSFEMGVQYSQIRFSTKSDFTEILQWIEIPIANPVTYSNVVSSSSWLDIPIKANIFLGKGKLKYIGSLGIINSFFLNGKGVAQYTYNDGTVSTARFNYSSSYNNSYIYIEYATVSSGIVYQASKHISLRAEPVFRCAFGGDYNDLKATYPYSRPFSLGLMFGVYYHF